MELYTLFRENVYRIVDSPLKRDKLINEGFALVQTPFNVAEVESYSYKETDVIPDDTMEDIDVLNIMETKNTIIEEDIYQNMTYQELQKLAKEKGIELKRDWKKRELIEAIKAVGDVK